MVRGSERQDSRMNINLPGDKAISPVIGQRFAAALPPAHSFTETKSDAEGGLSEARRRQRL